MSEEAVDINIESLGKDKGDTAEVEAGIQKWLLEKLSAENPAITDINLSDFTKPEVGSSNETLLFDAIVTENGQESTLELVARLQPSGPSVFIHYDLDLQYKVMELLQGTDVLVPELIGFEKNSELLGTPFYLMKRLPGKVIVENPPYYTEGWFTEISDEDRGAIWRNGIKNAAIVSRQDWKALGFDFLLPKNGETCLEQLLEEQRIFLEWAEEKGRPFPMLRGLYKWLVENKPQDEEPIALIWGDCKPGNLLITDTDISAVIDWEMARLGNPVHDMAWWMTLDNSMSEGLKDLMGMDVPKLPGIPSQEELIVLWEKESGFSAEHFDYYEVCCAFEFGICMASIMTNYIKDGLIPEEMEMDINHTCTPLMKRLIETHNIVIEE